MNMALRFEKPLEVFFTEAINKQLHCSTEEVIVISVPDDHYLKTNWGAEVYYQMAPGIYKNPFYKLTGTGKKVYMY